MRPESERGAALLTVLLLVAVIAVLAATALEKLRVATRLAGNAGSIEQAHAYTYAAETLAVAKVGDLLAQSPERVTLVGGWSNRPFPLPVPGGSAVARVSDGGNCFNLNGLVTEVQGIGYGARTSAVIQFARLLRLVNAPGAPDAIAAAAADWIDSDTSPLPGGAEDSSYGSQATPYRTANTLMADPSELRAVAGVTPDVYRAVRPWICTLPEPEPSKININTLTPEQAPLLAMLLPDTLGVGAARSLLLRRPVAGYGDTSTFWNQISLGDGGTADPAATAQTSVKTEWFDLRVDVALGGTTIEERALIDATRAPVRLVSRQWGEPS